MSENPGIDKKTRVLLEKFKHGTTTEFRNSHSISSLSPLPITQRPKNNDLTGKVIGRMVVVGVYPDQPSAKTISQKGLRWVVKCSCGRYETRFSKAIKQYNNRINSGSPDYGLCQQCRMTDVLRNSQR